MNNIGSKLGSKKTLFFILASVAFLAWVTVSAIDLLADEYRDATFTSANIMLALLGVGIIGLILKRNHRFPVIFLGVFAIFRTSSFISGCDYLFNNFEFSTLFSFFTSILSWAGCFLLFAYTLVAYFKPETKYTKLLNYWFVALAPAALVFVASQLDFMQTMIESLVDGYFEYIVGEMMLAQFMDLIFAAAFVLWGLAIFADLHAPAAAVSKKQCPSCGQTLASDTRFCPTCGATADPVPAAEAAPAVEPAPEPVENPEL